PDTDLSVARQQSYHEGPEAHHHDGQNQHGTAANSVAEMTEEHAAQWPRYISNREDTEVRQRADDGIGRREERFSKNQRCGGAVNEEVVPLADRTKRTCQDYLLCRRHNCVFMDLLDDSHWISPLEIFLFSPTHGQKAGLVSQITFGSLRRTLRE